MGNEEFYLFSQAYRKGIENYYGMRVHIEESMRYSRAHNDLTITRTMKKILMYVRYIEKEYDIEVFEKTKRKCAQNNRARCA